MRNVEIQFVTDRAVHACESCKRRKRGCDRRLPRCSSCVRKKLSCEYLDSDIKPLDESPHPNGSDSHRQARQSQLPNVFFLDHEVFRQGQMTVPTPSLPIPPYILSLLGGNTEIQTVASTFFATVHTYLPIISKKTFHAFLNPLLQQRADIALLSLCMKVILWKPSALDNEPSQTTDYLSSKRYLVELENAGVFTLPMLQARLLLSMYEYGQGIYPAAYISIGVCASQGFALGLSEKTVLESGGRTLTWMEQEERRRIWWAIVILERIIYLGSVGTPLVTQDPTSSDLLPSNDDSWDQAVPAPNYPINSPVGSQVNMGRFARLAHATHLLSQVIRHIAFSFVDSRLREEEVVQLDRTIRALMVLCQQESQRTNLRYCNPISICASSLMLLYSHYIPPELSGFDLEDSHYRSHSWTAIQDISVEVASGYHDTAESHTVCLAEISPLVLHSVYKAGTFLVRLNRETQSRDTEQALQTVRKTLEMKNTKWKSAGAYLQILEARVVMNTC